MVGVMFNEKNSEEVNKIRYFLNSSYFVLV